MSIIKSETCLNSKVYIAIIKEKDPEFHDLPEAALSNNLTVDECEHLIGFKYWKYPLTEIEECMDHQQPIVLVKFEEPDGVVYRFCEVPE